MAKAPSGGTNRPAGQRDKRRSDVPRLGQSVDALQREVAAEIENCATDPQETASDRLENRHQGAPRAADGAHRDPSPQRPAAGSMVVLAADERQ
jgi:hypothetical protein